MNHSKSPLSMPGLALASAFMIACWAQNSAAQTAPPNDSASAKQPAPGSPSISETAHGPNSSAFPSHHFQFAPHSPERVQLGVNFGLVQLALHGVNVALELRYKRLWLEYSHGEALTLNHLPSTLTAAERAQNLHVYVPYTTGFGVGATVLDELWVGMEFKLHRYEVSNGAGFEKSYETASIGPVVGYKLFIWRGLYTDLYARYWPNVASTLKHGEVSYAGPEGERTHEAHDWGLFANASLGWAFDL
jgi:hypothetical protein